MQTQDLIHGIKDRLSLAKFCAKDWGPLLLPLRSSRIIQINVVRHLFPLPSFFLLLRFFFHLYKKRRVDQERGEGGGRREWVEGGLNYLLFRQPDRGKRSIEPQKINQTSMYLPKSRRNVMLRGVPLISKSL